MTNRHERRRAEKLGSETTFQQIEVSSITGSVCAWDGCEHVSTNPDKDGWSHMLLYRGPIKLAIADIRQGDIQRDCCLCPEHARLLDETLLKPIRPYSDQGDSDDDVRFLEDGAGTP